MGNYASAPHGFTQRLESPSDLNPSISAHMTIQEIQYYVWNPVSCLPGAPALFGKVPFNNLPRNGGINMAVELG